MMKVPVLKSELLKNKEVIEEINKHKWIESQKAGRDIGFDKAAAEWITKYADEWETTQESKKGPKVLKKIKVAKF